MEIEQTKQNGLINDIVFWSNLDDRLNIHHCKQAMGLLGNNEVIRVGLGLLRQTLDHMDKNMKGHELLAKAYSILEEGS